MESKDKTRNDVSAIFQDILITFKHEYDSTNDDHIAILSAKVDYLCSFGTNTAYNVLWEYAYVRAENDFFSWAKILEILKEKIAIGYNKPKMAWEKLRQLMLNYGYHTKPPTEEIDDLLGKFIEENGGWTTVCNSPDLDKLEAVFLKTYPKILNEIVIEKMRKANNE